MSQKQFVKVSLDSLVIDPALQFFPDWDEEKLGLTIKQIEDEKDVRVPVVIDERSRVLDGHQRVRAAKAAGISEVSCEVVSGLDETDRLAYAIGQINRRHLSQSEIREAVRRAVLELHRYSDMRISRTIGIVSDKTVRAIRLKLIGEGRIPKHDTLIGLGNVPQPANKPKTHGTATPGGEGVKDEGKPGDTKPGAGDAGKHDGRPDPEAGRGGEAGLTDAAEEAGPDEKATPAADGPPDQPPEVKPSATDVPKIQLFTPPESDEQKPGAAKQDEPKQDEPKQDEPKQDEPKQDEPKPKGGRRQSNYTTSGPLTARLEDGRLVLEGTDLASLPPGLREVTCFVVRDAKATHLNVQLDVSQPALVIHCPEQK